MEQKSKKEESSQNRNMIFGILTNIRDMNLMQLSKGTITTVKLSNFLVFFSRTIWVCGHHQTLHIFHHKYTNRPKHGTISKAACLGEKRCRENSQTYHQTWTKVEEMIGKMIEHMKFNFKTFCAYRRAIFLHWLTTTKFWDYLIQ